MRLVGAIVVLAVLVLITFSGSVSAAGQSTITLSPAAGIVGSRVSISGSGFPPNSDLSLVWETANATWQLSGNPTQVTGISTTPRQLVLADVGTGALGSFSTNVTAPDDYGGQHVLRAYLSNGSATGGSALFTLEPSFRFAPSSGPAGTPIEVTAKGLGYGLYSTSYHLYWDNSYAGYFTAVSTGGSTNFTFYASGTPGTHYLQVYQGYPGPGYLNPQQGPPASETQSNFPPYVPLHGTFVVTGGSTDGGGLNLPGAPVLVLLGASLAVCGLSVPVARGWRGKRRALTKTLAAVIVVVVVLVVGGVSAFFVFSSGPSGGTEFIPEASAFRPGITLQQSNVTSGPTISVSPIIASVGQNITVRGAGFASNSHLPLTWTTRKGNNLHGYQQVAEPLRNVTAGPDGSFAFGMTVPADLGGVHFIAASNLTEHSNGTLFIQRTASINATQGPAGTTVAITLLGVGWTFDTNIAALDYDNGYIGYGCGFNSGGNVTFYLTVTGSPGVHTIDVYPSVWWGPSTPSDQLGVEYRYPLLTPQDHPELMPSFHFTFLITPPGSQSRSSGDIVASVSSLPLASAFLPGALLPVTLLPVWRSNGEAKEIR